MVVLDKINIGDLVIWHPRRYERKRVHSFLKDYYIGLVVDYVEGAYMVGDIKVLTEGRVCFWNSNICEVLSEG